VPTIATRPEWEAELVKIVANDLEATANRLRALELLGRARGYFDVSNTSINIAFSPDQLLAEIRQKTAEIGG